MNKQEFLESLRESLSGVPLEDIDERVNFYSEMIDDRIEEGLDEAAAVAEAGNIDDIVSQTVSDLPLSKLVKKKIKSRRPLKTLEIVLLALGSPIWLSLLISLFAVAISVYAVLWSAVACLWAVGASFVGCFIGGVAIGVVYIVTGSVFGGIGLIGAGIFCAGISLLWLFVCKAGTRGILFLTKKIFFAIKMLFVRGDKRK